MDLRQLELFVAVAEERHFRNAAVRSHISQSALSSAIKALETDLGATLFLRTTRFVELTEAGRALLAEARRTLAAADAARAAVSEVQGAIRGHLRVGAIPTPDEVDQAHLLARFRERHPQVQIEYVRNTSMALIEDVANGRLDLALVSMPPRLPESVEATALRTDDLALVCPHDHRLAQRDRVAPRDLQEEIFVGMPPRSVGFDAIDAIVGPVDRAQRVPFVVNEIATILDFVAVGLGVSLVPQLFTTSRRDVAVVPLRPTMTWTLAVVGRPAAQQSAAARAFRSIVEAELGPPT